MSMFCVGKTVPIESKFFVANCLGQVLHMSLFAASLYMQQIMNDCLQMKD